MSSLERQQHIVEIINAKGYESVINLCKALKFSGERLNALSNKKQWTNLL